MYTKQTAKNGRVMYRKDGNLIPKADIPQEELIKLETFQSGLTVDKTSVDDAQLTQGPKCIFDGEPATTTKNINGRTANLCAEHYMTRTTGEVAEQIRKVMDQEA